TSRPAPSVTRWCARSWARWSTSAGAARRPATWRRSSAPRTAPRPASPRPRTACACGRFCTDSFFADLPPLYGDRSAKKAALVDIGVGDVEELHVAGHVGHVFAHHRVFAHCLLVLARFRF